MRARRLLLLPLLYAGCAGAATYPVGPTRPHTSLNQLFAAVDLQGGDVVEVDGNVTYAGGVVVPAADGGSAGNPVVIRGIRVNGLRPRINGGGNPNFLSPEGEVFRWRTEAKLVTDSTPAGQPLGLPDPAGLQHEIDAYTEAGVYEEAPDLAVAPVPAG